MSPRAFISAMTSRTESPFFLPALISSRNRFSVCAFIANLVAADLAPRERVVLALGFPIQQLPLDPRGARQKAPWRALAGPAQFGQPEALRHVHAPAGVFRDAPARLAEHRRRRAVPDVLLAELAHRAAHAIQAAQKQHRSSQQSRPVCHVAILATLRAGRKTRMHDGNWLNQSTT